MVGICVAVGRVTGYSRRCSSSPCRGSSRSRRLIPVWFIAVPGPNAVVDLWQVAQSPVTGMCPVPCGFGVTP